MTRTQTWSADQNPMPAERRRSQRLQVAVQIEIRPAGTDVPMRLETTDISLGGCYVEMALTLDVGTELDIVLWIDQKKLSTRGVVVTRHPQFGNGIQFERMSTENAGLLLCFLDSHEASWHSSALPI
jgi:c-di-GMP-binding flagellar brake protein YcgR